MTKKHFEQLAKMVRDWRTRGESVSIADAADDLAFYLAGQNPRFDRSRFLAACKGEDSTDSAGRLVRYSPSAV